MAGGYIIDSSDTARLSAELRAGIEKLPPAIQKTVASAAKDGEQEAKRLAPNGKHTKRIRAGIRTRTRRVAGGVEATVEVADPLGAVLEFGAAYNRGSLFMKAGLDVADKKLAAELTSGLGGIL